MMSRASPVRPFRPRSPPSKGSSKGGSGEGPSSFRRREHFWNHTDEEKFFAHKFKSVFVKVPTPARFAVFGIFVIADFLVDVAFKGSIALVTLVPFRAKSAGLNTVSTVHFGIQLVVDRNDVHLFVLHLVPDVAQNNIAFNALGQLPVRFTSSWVAKSFCCKSMSTAIEFRLP